MDKEKEVVVPDYDWVVQIRKEIDVAQTSVSKISDALSEQMSLTDKYKASKIMYIDHYFTKEDMPRYYYNTGIRDVKHSLVNCNRANTMLDELLERVNQCRKTNNETIRLQEDIGRALNNGRLNNGLIGLAKEAVEDEVEWNEAEIPDGFYTEAVKTMPRPSNGAGRKKTRKLRRSRNRKKKI